MKTKLLVSAALLFTASAFAQTSDNNKNEHGTSVSTVAKSKTEADTKGIAVSTTASSKSQASVNRKNQTAEEYQLRKTEHQQRKAEHQAAREARKQEHKDFVAGIKSGNEARKEEHSTDVRSEIEARKELLNENKDRAKEAKDEAKIERKNSDDGLVKAEAKAKLGKGDKIHPKADRPVKVRAGVKTGADVKLRRPHVGAKVHGTAGLGLGNR